MTNFFFLSNIQESKTEEGKKGRAFGSVWNAIFQKLFFYKKKGKTEAGKKVEHLIPKGM
jgi:hypothetical protein